MRRVEVAVPSGFPGLPSYLLPADAGSPPVGARVGVPFRSKLLTGVITAVDPPPPPAAVTEREIAAVFDQEPFLPPALLAVLLRAARYYFAPPGELLRAAVPSRLLSLGEAVWSATRDVVGASVEGPRERQVLDALLARGRARLSELTAELGSSGVSAALRSLAARGLVHLPADAIRAGRAPVERAWVARPATGDPFGRRRRQREIHRHLLALGRPAAAAELRSAGATPAVLSALVRQGLVALVEEERRTDLNVHVGPARVDRRISHTAEQAAAVEAIRRSLNEGNGQGFLLHGVTGSGKTEVYLAALEACRAAGRQGILLVPEIALAPALVQRVVARFGDRVSLLHSGLGDGERAAEWERARRGEVDAVVGPRSAVFAPLPRAGLVVVDEAHESSYKQGESPLYDARDLARARSREEGLTLVFGTATPSMELERSAREGRLIRLSLPARPGGRPPASVEVVDLRGEPARPGDHGRVLFATRTVEILREAFERGEQAILLLNRRGFAPALICRACGEDFRCSSCSVARTYHQRGRPRLVCHYCGEEVRAPESCPACASKVLMPVGFGTERLSDRFEELFPDIPYAVLDRDSASRRGGAAGVLADFDSGRARALLGTQMVAKGHDFPNATALAVLNADALLSFPDFRSGERTFQLVTQAAGRVGRGERPGLVAVQTARPEHDAIVAAVAQDHAAFAESELRFRRALRYPPYAHLLLALFLDASREAAERKALTGAAALRAAASAGRLRILGPAPAPIERLKGVWRFQLLLKCESREPLAEAGQLLASLAEPPRLDVDPQSLM